MKRSNTTPDRKEPEFLIEMPHSLRHLIMKRGQMLRSGRTRTMFCLGKGGPKSWLQAKLIPNAGESTEENWDKAHEVAARFKRELHSDVYVEPANEFGRFKEMTAPPLPPEMDSADTFGMPNFGVDGGRTAPSDPFGSFGVGGPSGFDPFGGMPRGHSFGGAFGAVGFGGGHMNIPGMPQLPDPMRDILPPQVRQAMGMGQPTGDSSEKAKRKELAFPPLRDLPGFSDLPETKQKMFEVEAAQLQGDETAPALPAELELPIPTMNMTESIDAERTLAALSVHPKISAALKRFLLESFEAATESAAETQN
ncbi:MAG: hypothetical protein JSS83_29225 [Cyanobacteria bacterium SZAS LIN-3]|nr:hypothetical protein [Cyanobacteria bacterium SZAS LIN-3]